MAVLQKIRSKGALLLVIIGLALFAFIAEEFVRSTSTTANERGRVAGEVNGKRIDYQDFQQLVEQYKDALKFMRGNSTFSEMESAQAEDQAWNMYVTNQLIVKECDKLGLTVTDKELQDVLNNGTHPMLMQTPFLNQQQGRFDVNQLKQFLTQYDQMQVSAEVPEQYKEQYASVYKYWKFVEKSLRDNLLQQKYQALLQNCILSNPIEAKMSYEDNANVSDILLASFDLRTVQDKDVKISDSDLKAKYDEYKERYRQFIETRDINFIAVSVEASDKDKAALAAEMSKYAESINTTDDLASLVRKSNSLVPYNDVWVTKKAYPQDIQNMLDSVATGSVKGSYYEMSDNTDNIIKVVAKMEAPDSIQYKAIQVGGKTVEEARKSADSIYAALQAGAVFDSIAKKYNQPAQEQWIVTSQYETAPNLDDNTVQMINTLNTASTNELKNLAFEQGNLIIKVTDRKAMTTKYKAAVIKRSVAFSKETYSKAYNDFSRFLATNTTREALEKNATKSGYQYQTLPNMMSNAHFIAGIPSTKEALRWTFNKDTKEGDVSPLYECGENNTLLVVVLNKIHEEGYRPFEDMKDEIKAEVMAEKKADILANKLSGVKSIAQAQAQKAAIDTLTNINFGGIAQLPSGAVETKINGSISGKKNNDFVGPIKGNQGVYFYQVLNSNKADMKYDENEQMNAALQQHMRNFNTVVNDLYLKANVKDKRYLFF